MESGYQGIVHVISPELGFTHPGMTIVCGDSHTSTHGAFGALAFGIGSGSSGDYFCPAPSLSTTTDAYGFWKPGLSVTVSSSAETSHFRGVFLVSASIQA